MASNFNNTGVAPSGDGNGALSYANYAAAIAAAIADVEDGRLVYIESAGIYLVWSTDDERFYPQVLSGETPAMELKSLVLASAITGLSDGDPLVAFTDEAGGTRTWTPSSANATWVEAGGPNGTACLRFASNAVLDGSGADLLAANASTSYTFVYAVVKAAAGTKTVIVWPGSAATSGAELLLRVNTGGAMNVGGYGSGGSYQQAAVTGGFPISTWNGAGGQVAYADGKVRPVAGEGASNYRHLFSQAPSNLSNSNATPAGSSLAATIGGRSHGVDYLNGDIAGVVKVNASTPLTAANQNEIATWLDLLTGLQS